MVAQATSNIKDRLPNGWRLAKLGEVCEIIAGQSPPGSTYRDTPQGLPFFQGKADFGPKHPVARVWCIEPIRIALPGDILISVRAPVGPTNIADVECCIGRGLAAVRAGEKVHPDFLLAALKHHEPSLVAIGSGSTFSAIKISDLSGLSFRLPPIDEQQRIAAILNQRMAAIDRARAAAQSQLGAAQALPAAYLSAVFRTTTAKNWPRRQLGEMCDIVAPQVDPKIPEYGALPHVNGENIESGTGRLTHLHTAAEDRMTSGKYLFEPGDVLYSKLRPYLRKAVVVDFRGVCSADMYPIKVDRNLLDPHFAAWLLLSDQFTEYADAESRRARMPKLNRGQLFAWRAPTPNVAEQQRIAASLSEMIARALHLRQVLDAQIGLVKELPAALLRQAFNGEL